MPEQTMTFEQIHGNYCEFIDSCNKFNSFTRSIRLQKEKIAECDQYIRLIKGFRQQAIDHAFEKQANHFFHMQCMVNALRSALLMWVDVKEEKFQNAWSNLIDAQEYTTIALKIDDYEGIRNLETLLQSAEKSIFPGWARYNSPGWIESIGECSAERTFLIVITSKIRFTRGLYANELIEKSLISITSL